MKTVHAFRRLPTEQIEVDFHNRGLKFKANDRGQVVCEMDDDVADALVKAAPCGYRLLGEPTAPAPAPKATPKQAAPSPVQSAVEALIGTDKHGSHIQIGEESLQLGAVVAAAHTASGLSVADWNALDGAARDALIDGQIEKLTTKAGEKSGDGEGGASPFTITSPDDVVIDLGPMTDDEVRAFAEKQGLPKPHHAKKGDKLKLAVIEALKAQ